MYLLLLLAIATELVPSSNAHYLVANGLFNPVLEQKLDDIIHRFTQRNERKQRQCYSKISQSLIDSRKETK